MLAALALGLAAMVVWGYLMWWRRRPTRATGPTFGSTPGRGPLRRTPLPAVAGIAVLTVALGVFFPLLGISLAVFLVLDLILDAVTTRRSRT